MCRLLKAFKRIVPEPLPPKYIILSQCVVLARSRGDPTEKVRLTYSVGSLQIGDTAYCAACLLHQLQLRYRQSTRARQG